MKSEIRPRLFLFLKCVLALICMYRVFCLDIYPATTNDSIAYLGNAVSNIYVKHPLRIVHPPGYRLAGYPLFMSVWHNLAPFLSIDALSLIALSQRVLLAVSLLWLVFNMGLVSAPLAWFFSSPIFLAQSNLLLTEGMTVPVAIIFSIALAGIYSMKDDEEALRDPAFWTLFLIISTAFSLLVLTRANLIVYALPLVIVGLDVKMKGYRPKVALLKIAWPLAVLIVVLFAFVFAVSFGNFRKYNKFTPAIATERVFYWGAWYSTFILRRENRNKPALAEFFDKGSPHPYVHRIERACKGDRVKCAAPILRERAKAMLDAAGISLAGERVRSFVMGFLGGEKVEIRRMREAILDFNGKPLPEKYQLHNWYKKRYGMEKLLFKFNRSETPVTISGLTNSPLSMGNFRATQMIISFAALALLTLLILTGRISLMSPFAFALVAYVVLIVAFANILVDIWRFILPGWTVFVVLSFYAVREALADIAGRGTTRRPSVSKMNEDGECHFRDS